MLILRRKIGQCFYIGQDITVENKEHEYDYCVTLIDYDRDKDTATISILGRYDDTPAIIVIKASNSALFETTAHKICVGATVILYLGENPGTESMRDDFLQFGFDFIKFPEDTILRDDIKK